MHCVPSFEGGPAGHVFKIKYALNVLLATAFITFIVVSEYVLPLCLKASWVYIGAVVFLEIVCRVLTSRARSSGTIFDIPKGKHKGKIGSKIAELIYSGVLSISSLALCHIITVLFGAPITHAVEETATLAGVIAALALVRPVIAKGPNQALQLIDTWTWGGEAESRGFFVVFGAWLGALPIPLDWDRPWQVWPLTCIGGALVGELSAHIFLLTRPFPSAKKSN